MGYWKERALQQDEQGWTFSDGVNICYRCISDRYLRNMIRSTASKRDCDFCHRTTRSPIAIPFDNLMRVLAETIFQYYSHAESASMAWDPEDQMYIGTTYDTWDLIREEFAISDREPVLQAIIDSLGMNTWCDKHPYSLDGVDRYLVSWEDFCKTVKHRVRYFFDTPIQERESTETIPVPEMLDELKSLIHEAGLIQPLPSGTPVFRARPHGRKEVCNSWKSLGSPPDNLAVSNRMSAAGISVFYGALDLLTAVAEVSANLPGADRRVLTAGTWTSTRDLTVLDLSRLPELPSVFSTYAYDREHLVFLRQFVRNITEPVIHDGREHVEYVPTQILTEYFRHRYPTSGGPGVDAIIYPSAQRPKGRSIVIFASQRDLDPAHWANRANPLIVLDDKSVRRVRRRATHSQARKPKRPCNPV